VSSAVVSDIKNNPGNFKVQLVSPLGFFSEVYDGEQQTIPGRDRGIDMITYVRVLTANGGTNNELINPGQPASSVGNSGFVAYGKWRNTNVPGVFGGLANGEAQFGISSFSDVLTEERGSFFELTLSSSVYASTGSGTHQFLIEQNSSNHFLASINTNFHEPMYMVNIIRDGVNVPDLNVNNFIETGHYQKINAIIGRSNGSEKQEFFLVDERWEDCIPFLDSSVTQFAGLIDDDVFVFAQGNDGIDRAWINVTFKSAPQITTITDDIKNNGFFVATDGTKVFGIYTHENLNNLDREFKVIFDATGFTVADDIAVRVPNTGELIRVKYSTRLPIRVFGGDRYIGESIFAPIDRKSDSSSGNVNQFFLSCGFPYFKWQINDRVYLIKRTEGIDKIQDDNFLTLKFVRQMTAMFTAETLVHLPLAFNQNDPTGFYPLVNYIMRPHRWDTGKSAVDQNIFSQYETDYGTTEIDRWVFGGFRFEQSKNTDYSQIANTQIPTSKPKTGFEEKSFFCTAVIWSEKRATNIVDAPGVRTFPSLNQFIVDDDTGEIKYAFSALANNGSNLYAFTEDGIVLLLTDQRIITELSGQQLATVGTEDSGVLKQIWISKEIGLHDEMWRSFAEWNNTAWFANKNSVYKFTSNELEDIGRIKYHSRIFPEILDNIADGFTDDVTGVYDILHNEYWLSVKTTLIVFNEITKHWIGQFAYFFDRFISFKNDIFGMRDLQTFELNSGKLISGRVINSFVIQASPTESRRGKEFIRIRVESDNKPNQIEFTDNVEDMLAGIIDSFLDTDVNPDELLDYDGFEGYIPRSALKTKDRTQGRVLFFKIIHKKQEDFKIISSQVQYKELV